MHYNDEMGYYESAEGETITRGRALRELADHGVTAEGVAEFDDEVQPDASGMYDAQAVLVWLGY